MDADIAMRYLAVFEDKTTKNQRDSPLLRLPAELRNKVYDMVCSDTQISLKKLHPAAPARNHQGALALLSTCRQLRHEAYSTFHTMTVFEVSIFVLDQLKKSCFFLNSELYNSIQSIQMRGHEVERWCYFVEDHDGQPLETLGRGHMYIGLLPSLKHILAVYCIDEGEPCSHFSDQEIADTLNLAFGRKDLRIHIQFEFQGSVFG